MHILINAFINAFILTVFQA